jgi:hypothetical protein
VEDTSVELIFSHLISEYIVVYSKSGFDSKDKWSRSKGEKLGEDRGITFFVFTDTHYKTDKRYQNHTLLPMTFTRQAIFSRDGEAQNYNT